MSRPSPAICSRLAQRALHLSRLFKVVLADGTVYRWAALDSTIEYRGETYSPIGGIEATDAARQIGLSDREQDFRGLLTVDAISDDDLRFGRLRGAKVWEFLIDHEDPALGPILEDAYTVTDTSWGNVAWKAQVVGVTRRLAMRTGAVIGRSCHNTLGDAFGSVGTVGCKVDVEGTKQAAKGVLAVVSRAEFTLENTLSGSPGDDHFAFGRVRWLTGNNAGTDAWIASFTAATRTVRLTLPVPADKPIQATDTLDLYSGCDQSFSTCGSRHGQQANFGASPFVKGNDQAIQGVG
jgi:uncharacterized phage protein (TIGR02218 family)